MTIQQLLGQAQAELEKVGINSARLDSQLLLEFTTSKDRAWLIAHPEHEPTTPETALFKELIKQRAARVPLVHLVGRREFYGLELEITPDVLTPRAETEKMVDWAIKHVPDGGRLLDMGTGSGALAIAIAKHRPDLEVVASDVSPAALAVASRNAKRYKLGIDFVQSDLWQAVPGHFDAVATNLPYLSDEAMTQLMPEVEKEPRVALTGGGDGLDIYRRFLKQLPAHLKQEGWLFTECDPWQQPDLIAEAAKTGLKLVEQDYFILALQAKN